LPAVIVLGVVVNGAAMACAIRDLGARVAIKVVASTNTVVPYVLPGLHCVEMSYEGEARFAFARVITRSVLELPRLALARVKVIPATNLLVPTAVTVTEVIESVPATTVSVQPVQPEDGVMSE
jgi:hypothetical protein